MRMLTNSWRRLRLSDRVSDALVQLREAIRLSPANPGLHALLAQALAGTGQFEQAIAEQKAALHVRENDADDWNDLGVLEARAGKIAGVREAFLHALRLVRRPQQFTTSSAGLTASMQVRLGEPATGKRRPDAMTPPYARALFVCFFIPYEHARYSAVRVW